MKKSEYNTLATAKTVERVQAYINEYACSHNYRVDPETLAITNSLRKVPAQWFVMRYRGGFLFGFRK